MLPVALLAVTIPQNPPPAPQPAGVIAPTAQPIFSNGAQSSVLIAQSITPGDTSTIVSPMGNQIDITGGQVSGDGVNLFHSFEQFGLSAQQTANFIANPQVQNVLGRVLGGDASYIDGILQVSNSNANLYLINPAGILFGQNARLDLTGSFTATTADRVGFDGSWLDVFETHDYTQLMGAPTQFSFGAAQPGSVVNLGNLAVGESEALTLLGGNVVNVGSALAPGGRVTLTAVNGQQTVTLGSADGLLTMELAPLETDRRLSVLSLPELLTGGDFIDNNELIVTSEGTVSLHGVNIPKNTGTTAVAGTLEASGGQINLLGDRIALVDATLDVSGTLGGGTIRVGGGYQGQDLVPNADIVYVGADSNIRANGSETGKGGQSIVWADKLTQFYGNIDARGGTQTGDGGFVEVSSKEQLIFTGMVQTIAVNGQMGTLLIDPTNIVIASGSADGDSDGLPDTFQGDTNGLLGQVLENDFLDNNITLYESELERLNGNTNILLQSTNNIIINDMADDELTFSVGTGTIEFIANSDMLDGGDVIMEDINDSLHTSSRDISISGENLNLGNLTTEGGNLQLLSNGTIEVTTLDTRGDRGGDITINAGGTFRATGAFLSSDNVNSFDNLDNSIIGEQVAGVTLLTSIDASGDSDMGGSINIVHGARTDFVEETFIVGPNFQRAQNSELVYRRFSLIGDRAILNEAVMPTGIPGEYTNGFDFFSSNEVIAVAIPLTSASSTVSFTAGAISSNQNDIELVISVRELLEETEINGFTNGFITVLSEPGPSINPGITTVLRDTPIADAGLLQVDTEFLSLSIGENCQLSITDANEDKLQERSDHDEINFMVSESSDICRIQVEDTLETSGD